MGGAMKKALIFENKVVDIAPHEFPVAEPLFWVECDDEVKVGWTFESGQFVAPPPAPPEKNKTQTQSESDPERI